jgi:hypothetical protein
MKAFGNLQIKVSTPEKLRTLVEWCGESDAMDPGSTLTPYLLELAQTLRGRMVELRFHQLKYMNSSTVTPVMQFVQELSGLAESVTVLYRADLQWQATSFRAMRVVARKWNNVKVVGE